MENSRKFEDLLAAAYISGAAEAFKKSKELDSEAVNRNVEELKILRHRFLARAESAGYREPVHHIDAAKQMAHDLLVKIKERAESASTHNEKSTNANSTMHNAKETPPTAPIELAGVPAPAAGILKAISGITDSIKAFTFGNGAPSPSPSPSEHSEHLEHLEHPMSLTTNTSKPLPPVLQLGGKRYRLKKTYRKRR